MATKEEILDSISALTVLELKELLDAFEDRFGVTAAAPVAVAAAAPAGGGGAGAAGRETAGVGVVLPGGGGAPIQV
jgi:large subunit ribosomal protein L7/L12